MTHNPFFEFILNQEHNSIRIKREFSADLTLVWSAWTQAELLDQWWAPKPYKAQTKSMDFREGGTWLYAMEGPEDTPHWCKADYQSIDPMKSYTGLDAFCDENGIVNSDFPRSKWNISFSSSENGTLVEIEITYAQWSDLEKIIELGFREGFTMALGNLDQYLEAQIKLRTALKHDTQPRVCTYLNFPGNTEEAFNHYRNIFRSEFNGAINRFGELPPAPGQPPIGDAIKNMILHIELPITANHIIMGTDAPAEMGFTVIQGNNMHINLEPESKEETDRLFAALSDGGKITQPLQDMFWGAYFGSCTDRFGINWMLNYRTTA